MIVKNLLLSTVLTAAFSLSTVHLVSAADAVKPAQVQSKAVKPSGHKHHAKRDDAYSPSHHPQAAMPEKTETMMIFAEVGEPKQHEAKNTMHHNDNGLDIKIGGKVDIQYGFINQRNGFKNPSNNDSLRQFENISPQTMSTAGSAYTNQDAMVSNGEITVKAEKSLDTCNKYGLEIALNTNTSPASSGNTNPASKVFIYTEGNFGRVELGANDGVNKTMSFGAPKIAKATGGIDGDYSAWVPYTAVDSGNNLLDSVFLTTPALPYSAYNQTKANKITYYTPTYNGFKGGLSYIRDATVQGTLYEALSFKGEGFKNVFEVGTSYENKFNEMSLGLSLNGQIGEARDAYINNIAIPLNKLGAWEVGGKVSYDAFTVAASYGDWNTSGTQKDITAITESAPSRKANFWTAGLSYDYKDQGGMSITYVASETRGVFSAGAYNYINDAANNYFESTNKYEALSLGGEYKLMPGLMPYAELTGFNYTTDLENVETNKGSVLLAGVKLNF